MTMNSFLYFVTLAQTLNFTKAAQKCYISQPAFSKQISVIEQQLGVQLFVRNKKSVLLTVAGKQCLEYATTIVQQYDRMLSAMHAQKQLEDMMLTIGCLDIRGMQLLVDAQNYFNRESIPISLNILSGTQNELMDKLLAENEKMDAIITLDAGLESYPLIDYEEIYLDTAYAILPKDHALSDCAEVSISDLRNERVIHSSIDTSALMHNMMNDMCAQFGLSPKYGITANNIEDILIGVATGGGIAIVFKTAISMELEQVRVRKIKEAITTNIVLAWNRINAKQGLSDLAAALKQVAIQ